MGDLLVLPELVEEMINKICVEKQQDPPDAHARRKLAEIGEAKAIDVVCRIYYSKKPIRTTLSRYITWFVDSPQSPSRQSCSSPTSPTPTSPTPSPPLHQGYSPLRPSPSATRSSQSGGSCCSESPKDHVLPSSHTGSTKKAIDWSLFSSDPGVDDRTKPSYQSMVLCRELEFRKFFLLQSYIGRRNLEDVISPDKADEIAQMKDLPMHLYESNIWETYGENLCDPSDRVQSTDWDSGKIHFYHCQVYQDGTYNFKGPCLKTTTTHLQRTLGDDNVLIVKFVEEGRSYIDRIFREGIIVGLWRYRFFVFKDERHVKKKKGAKNKTPISAAFKSYFVRFNSISACGDHESYALSSLKVNEARCLFMHVHMVSSIPKYMARFSLILSKTIKLPIDLSSVVIERIQDVQCRDENGSYITDEDGEALIFTDGTGFISEDLALMCPQNFGRAKYINDNDFQKFRDFIEHESVPFEGRGKETWNREPPLLMQCRLFSKGCAVKGTLLVNKKLKPGTIQIRPSMLKVEKDVTITDGTFDSLEIVAVSHRLGRNKLSKYLIALLSYGGVPRCYFLDLLTSVLEETKAVFSNKRAALNVAMNNEGIDDDSSVLRMILAGIPLNEPHLQNRLSVLAKSERNLLKEGKLPISESFYLMGTADPTGLLKTNEVCVILDNGQISGKVLVYRNPGLHFGDIHVLEAVYVKELEDVIGNAKYGIFFSSKGSRSVAYEIATGDFDGDLYWVSRNPQLLKYFSASKPWSRVYPSLPAVSKKPPKDLSTEELEHELFQLFLQTRKPSFSMAFAADSWLAFMDRLLILGDDCAEERDALREKILKLVDLYYDAVDAPKTGKKVNIPENLKAERFPHYMGKVNSYNSTSVLGEIFDKVQGFQSEEWCIGDIWKLPCFNVEVPQEYVSLWTIRYHAYLSEMTEALKKDDESKNGAANEVIKKYKQMLYEAADFEESRKDVREIYDEARAIYHITYNNAINVRDVGKCGFAWKVAGRALVYLYAMSRNEKVIPVSLSTLREIIF